MARELDEFLDVEDTGQAGAEQPPAAVETPGETLAAEQPGQQAAPVAEPEEEAHDPAGDSVNFRKLREIAETTKKERNDYKGERDRLAGEMAAIKAELEAARKANEAKPPAPPTTQITARQAVPIPNPVEDPVAYHAYQEQQRFSDRLDISEDRLRETVGNDAEVDAKIAKFKELAVQNPALHQELRNHRHPYKFAYDYVARTEALAEIGDPKSYREKLAAEIRAQVEAEVAGVVQLQQPAARIQLPQSLGTARSAMPRSTPVINIPEDLDEILRSGRR
jgi:hypothetical protein